MKHPREFEQTTRVINHHCLPPEFHKIRQALGRPEITDTYMTMQEYWTTLTATLEAFGYTYWRVAKEQETSPLMVIGPKEHNAEIRAMRDHLVKLRTTPEQTTIPKFKEGQYVNTYNGDSGAITQVTHNIEKGFMYRINHGRYWREAELLPAPQKEPTAPSEVELTTPEPKEQAQKEDEAPPTWVHKYASQIQTEAPEFKYQLGQAFKMIHRGKDMAFSITSLPPHKGGTYTARSAFGDWVNLTERELTLILDNQ